MADKKAYLVSYSYGEYDDYWETALFVTHNEKTAKKFVAKFNRLLKKWKKYYRDKYEDCRYGYWYIREDVEGKFWRWYSIHNTNRCYYHEIPWKE